MNHKCSPCPYDLEAFICEENSPNRGSFKEVK